MLKANDLLRGSIQYIYIPRQAWYADLQEEVNGRYVEEASFELAAAGGLYCTDYPRFHSLWFLIKSC